MTRAYQYFLSIVAIVTLLAPLQVAAQEDRITEEDIKLEELFIEGLAKRMEGDQEKAMEIFQEIASKDRRNHTVLYEIARIQKRNEKEIEALQTIDRAIRIAPENIWYHLFKAGVQETMGDYLGAAETQSMVVALDPQNSRHYFRMADNYLRVNRVQEALGALETLYQKNGSFEELHQRRYDIYRNTGQLNLAVEEIKSLIRLFPENTEYLYMLANYAQLSGNQKEAERLFKMILTIDPDDARAQLAVASSSKSEDSSEIEYLEGLKPLFANPEAQLDPKIIELIPFVEQLAANPNTELSLTLLDLVGALEKAHKSEAKIHALKGDILQLSGNQSKAISEYQKAIKLDKSVFTVWEQLLYLLAEEGDYEEMYETSEDALDVFPNQVRLWIFNAKALIGLKKQKDALNALDQARFMATGQTALLQEIGALRGAILFHQGLHQEAIKIFEETISINPGNLPVITKFAFYLSTEAAQLEEGKTQLVHQMKSAPNHPLLIGTLAVIHYLQNQSEEALVLLKTLTPNTPPTDKLINLIQSNTKAGEVTQFWRTVLEGGAS